MFGPRKNEDRAEETKLGLKKIVPTAGRGPVRSCVWSGKVRLGLCPWRPPVHHPNSKKAKPDAIGSLTRCNWQYVRFTYQNIVHIPRFSWCDCISHMFWLVYFYCILECYVYSNFSYDKLGFYHLDKNTCIEFVI